jgi:hypothetical protein
MLMDATSTITAIAALLAAIAKILEVAFAFWREKRRESKKRRPRK